MAVMMIHFLIYRSDKTGMASCHACVKIHSVMVSNYAENDSPHPQVLFAFGLTNLKFPPIKSF